MSNQNSTTIFTEDSPMLQRALLNQTSMPQGTASLGQHREVILLIRGMPERLMLTEGTTYTIGRFNMSTNLDKEVDLTVYGAGERGVSRTHAQLHIQDNSVFITDLGSTNGTFISGKRLTPHVPTLLHKGDEVLLGRLQVQFLFR
jgi:pSer/pThr/pTyr-binding forkhead associated (FHA) protein